MNATPIRRTHESADEFNRRAAGSPAIITEDMDRRIPNSDLTVWTPIHLAAGEEVTILRMTNAGFRGMELGIETAAGARIYGIPESALTF